MQKGPNSTNIVPNSIETRIWIQGVKRDPGSKEKENRNFKCEKIGEK